MNTNYQRNADRIRELIREEGGQVVAMEVHIESFGRYIQAGVSLRSWLVLIGQEQLIAIDIFDSVLEQAKHPAKRGFKDPAAVLTRVVVEDSLRRLSREEGFKDSIKATAMNDALRDQGRYSKPLAFPSVLYRVCPDALAKKLCRAALWHRLECLIALILFSFMFAQDFLEYQ